MAKIALTGGFKPIEEGIYVFKITKCEYKEDFGKLNFTLETSDGKKTFNNYNFGVKNSNEGAINSFSFFARTVMGKPELDEIDPETLVGKYVRAEVVHTMGENLDADGNPKVFANLRNWVYAEGFDGADSSKDAFDLDDILGD